jgi:spore coat protein U-like protein
MKRLLIAVAAVGIATASLHTTAQAATATGTLGTSATVVNTCSAGTNTMAYGNVPGLTVSTLLNITGTVSVTCTNAAPYNIGLDKGVTGTSVTARLMTDGATHTVAYTLFRDAARTLNWGTTVGTDTVTGTGTGAAQTINIYGQIPSQNIGFVNPYTDTVNVTITY